MKLIKPKSDDELVIDVRMALDRGDTEYHYHSHYSDETLNRVDMKRLLLIGKEEFDAEINGVTVERLRVFRQWLANGCLCEAIRKNGKPCRNRCWDLRIYPNGFPFFLCHVHKNHSLQ